MEGRKFDSEKPELYLLPPKALLEIGKVLSFGASKYAPDNWKKVPNLENRYTSAALRHILADMAGEVQDSETGLDHLAHAMCCLLFILEHRLNGKNQKEGTRESERCEHRESDHITDAFRYLNPHYKEGGVCNIKHLVQHEAPSEHN